MLSKGGRGQKNREEIGFYFSRGFAALRRSCARLDKTAMLRRLFRKRTGVDRASRAKLTLPLPCFKTEVVLLYFNSLHLSVPIEGATLSGIAPVFIEFHDDSLDVALFTVTNPKVTVFATHTDMFGTTSWFLIA